MTAVVKHIVPWVRSV